MSRAWWSVHAADLQVEGEATVHRAGWGAVVSRETAGSDWIHLPLPSPVSGAVRRPDPKDGDDLDPDIDYADDPHRAFNLDGLRLIVTLPAAGVSIAELHLRVGERLVATFAGLELRGAVDRVFDLPARRIDCGMVLCARAVWTGKAEMKVHGAGARIVRLEVG